MAAAEPAGPPAEQLAQQPDFVSDLALIDAALVARQVGAPSGRSPLANQAADRLADRIMRALAEAPAPVTAVPAPLVPATTSVLRFWLPHIPGVAPAQQLCPEVQAVVQPGTRAAAAAFLAQLTARGEAQGPGRGPRPAAGSSTAIVPLPLAVLQPGSQFPFGRPCCMAVQRGVLMMGGPPAKEQVPGVSGVGGLPAQLDLQTLTFALATIEGQVRLRRAGCSRVQGWGRLLMALLDRKDSAWARGS